MRKTIAAVCCCVVSACASVGTPVDRQQAESFQKGKATYAEVIAALGPPSSESLANDGTRMVIYTHAVVSARPQSFIPYIGPFIAKADTKNEMYLFTFDSNGVLKTVMESNGQSTVNAGVLAQ